MYLGSLLIVIELGSKKINHPFLSANEPPVAAQT